MSTIYMNTRLFAVLVAMASVGWLGTMCLALPPESELPRLKKPLAKLPAESQLPVNARRSPAAVAKLPSEQELPRPVAIKQAVDAPQIGIAELQDSRDNRARLRLSVGEHTSSVMALAFDASASHLFTGGDDKLVHHWRLTIDPESGAKNWLHEEAIRWQVGSGPSGRIRALACGGNILYIAGYGADGSRGEILRYNWVTRVWLPAWVKHIRPIARLWASPDGRVVSADEYLGLWLHRDGAEATLLEKPRSDLPIQRPIDVRFTPTGFEWYLGQPSRGTPWEIVRKVQGNNAPTALSPAVVTGAESRVFENIQKTMADALPNWKLTPEAYNIWKQAYGPAVELISVSPDGTLLAAVDTEAASGSKSKGHWLYVWKNNQLIVKTFLVDATKNTPFDYRALNWSSDSRTLAVLKVHRHPTRPLSKIELWEFAGEPKMRTLENSFGSEYYACHFSPDQKWLALSGQVAVFTLPLEQPNIINVRLPKEIGVLPLSEVSFSKTGYRWKGVHAKSNVTGDIVFDPQRMALDAADNTVWIPHSTPANNWAFKEYRLDREANSWIVKRGQTKLGAVDVSAQGFSLNIAVAEWIRQGDNPPTHLAVSYDRNRDNEIHIFSLQAMQNGSLKRVAVLNGHEGSVISLSVSADGKILLSAGADRQVCTWPLSAISSAEQSNLVSWQKYGATFEQSGAQLLVKELHPAAPLFEFGIRQGDAISALAWFKPSADGTQRVEQKVATDQTGLTFLNQPDFDTVVRFTYVRPGGEPTSVQLKPQWRPLYGQAFDSQREWATWTAAGFYAASFNGNSLFGWQINRGLEKPPSFYRADRFQAILERPELLRRVIELGSVDAAARAVGETLTSRFDPLKNAIALQPIVRILTPTADSELKEDQVVVKAEIEIASGTELASAKAFANGIPAKLQSQERLPTNESAHNRFVVTWTAALPRDQNVKLQVLAANSQRLIGASELVVHRQHRAEPESLPRMWIFAGAVGQYQDKLIPKLATPENNANSFTAQVAMAARGIYDVQRKTVLTGDQMTRSQWLALVRETIDEAIRPIAQPDDMVMIFLSGHGVQDEETDEYYYIPADADFRDVRAGKYDRCLNVSEIAPFTGLGCRTVVVLDTCHSGAFQPLESDRLRSAVRALQADMILTLTASEGDQKAAEDPTKPNSVFTEVVVKLLSQPRDTDGDKVLTMYELVQQVQSGVYESAQVLQKNSALSQKPKFIPSELLPFVRFPMAQVKQAGP